MKKIATLSLAILMAFFIAPSTIEAASLSDISDHKNETAINYLLDNDIVDGYDDNTYRPDVTINRAEFTKIIIEATYDSATIESCLPEQMQPTWTYTFFPDVDRYEWYAKYVCVAKVKDVISGYPDGLFRPDNKINKAEAIKIIATSQGYSVPDSVAGNLYSDVAADDWFAPHVRVAFDNNLLEDTGSAALSPDQEVTRGGMSEMIYRALASEGGTFEIPDVPEEIVPSEEEEEDTPAEDIPLDDLEEPDEEPIEEEEESNPYEDVTAHLERVTTDDPVAAENDIVGLLLGLSEYHEDGLTSAQLAVIDSPEKNYTDNIDLIREARKAQYMEEVDNEAAVEAYDSIQRMLYSSRALLLLSYDTGIGDISYHHDTDKAYVGVSYEIELVSSDVFHRFVCYPFAYEGYWKLKMPSEYNGQVDFSSEGLIESCDKEIKEESKLSASDLVSALYAHSASFAARIYVNGHLIENTEGLENNYNNSFLPLIEGTNTIEVEVAHDESFERSLEGLDAEEGDFEAAFDLEHDQLVIEIAKDEEVLVDFSMLKSEESKTQEFEYQP